MNSFMDTLLQLGPMRLGLLGAVAVGLLGFFFFFSMRLSQPPMALLYSELSPTDAGQITARLDQQQEQSLTWSWRPSTGTVFYVGASRTRSGVAATSRVSEAFVKLQVDVDDARAWWRERS